MAQTEANRRRQQGGSTTTTTTTPTTTTLTTGPDGNLEPSTIPSSAAAAACCCWWFIDNNKGGRQHLRGPYTVSQMGVLFDVGTLTDITQVWKAPDGEWRALKQAKDLIQDMDTQVADDKIQEEKKQGEQQQQQQRLPLDKIPSTEIRQCTSCITAQREGYCDLTYFWDRPNKMWLLWDEYEILCRNTGITEGLITNNKILRGGGRDIISTAGIQSNHDTRQKQKNNDNKDAAGAAAIHVPLDDPEKEAKRKKRREYRARKKLKQQAGIWKARVKEENNTSIYISGLPDDSTVEELYDLFTLAGAIKRDLETGHYKIKIYGLNDDDKNNKNNGSSWGMEQEEEGEKKRVSTSSSSLRRTGDALISYQSVESVPIAIDRYDDYKLREDCRIHVARASFDHHYGDSTVKPDKVDNTPDDDVANHLDNDTLKVMASRNNKRRLKLLELRRKEVEAAASWEDDQAGRDRAWKPIIVLKGMYTVQEANSDHAEEIYAAIKQDVQSEMCKFGEVKKVVVIEDSLDAYVCIKFKTMDEAQNAAANLASNNLTIPSTVTSSTAAVDRKASDMFFHDGRDLKSRPIIPPPTPSNNSVAGSSSSSISNNTNSIYDDINTVTRVTDDKATEREKDWERYLDGDDDSSDDEDEDDDEFIIHEEEGEEEDTLHPPE